MLTMNQVRKDLKEIRYYYSMQDLIDKSARVVPPIRLLKLVNRYNKAMENAPARLYVVYVSLYLHNNSQPALASDWGFCENYIRDLNIMLLEYLQSTVKEEE